MYKSVITGLRAMVALLLLVSAQVWAADGVVRSLSGGVLVNSTSAVVGTEVSSGDMLSTGPSAWVVVVMSDGTVLNLKSDTKVEVSNYVYNASDSASNASDVEIAIGTLRYVSGLIAETDPSDIAIRAGNTTLGLRGSESETNYDGVRVVTKVISGNWTSTNRNNTYNAGGGQQMDVDDATGDGETSSTPAGQRPTGGQGGQETGELASQNASDRGGPQPAGAQDDAGTQADGDDDSDADDDGDGEDDGGDTEPPPPADSQPPVFSDDPASTSDPNSGG